MVEPDPSLAASHYSVFDVCLPGGLSFRDVFEELGGEARSTAFDKIFERYAQMALYLLWLSRSRAIFLRSGGGG